MKKRLVSLFLALTMTWGLTACAGGSSAPASSAAPESAADPAASADAASAQGEAEGSKTDIALSSYLVNYHAASLQRRIFRNSAANGKIVPEMHREYMRRLRRGKKTSKPFFHICSLSWINRYKSGVETHSLKLFHFL